MRMVSRVDDTTQDVDAGFDGLPVIVLRAKRTFGPSFTVSSTFCVRIKSSIVRVWYESTMFD
jgi:hypothetical protein